MIKDVLYQKYILFSKRRSSSCPFGKHQCQLTVRRVENMKFVILFFLTSCIHGEQWLSHLLSCSNQSLVSFIFHCWKSSGFSFEQNLTSSHCYFYWSSDTLVRVQCAQQYAVWLSLYKLFPGSLNATVACCLVCWVEKWQKVPDKKSFITTFANYSYYSK